MSSLSASIKGQPTVTYPCASIATKKPFEAAGATTMNTVVTLVKITDAETAITVVVSTNGEAAITKTALVAL